MDLERRAGWIVSILLITQMAGSALVNFRLEAPLFGEPGFLVNAAAHAQQVGLSALVGLALGALFSGVAITVFPIVRAHSLCVAHVCLRDPALEVIRTNRQSRIRLRVAWARLSPARNAFATHDNRRHIARGLPADALG